jgi:hypothetical protein
MKILQNEIIGTQINFSTNFGGKLNFILSFLFLEHLSCCYMYFHDTYLYNYYNYFQPCALNVEFQHFILRFNKISLLCRYHWKRDRRWKRWWRQGDFKDNSIALCFLICRLHVILIALDFLSLFPSWLLFQLTFYIKYSNWYDGKKYLCLFHNILCT